MKDLFKKQFSSLHYFYSHLKYRIFLAVGISILVGVLDGFGLAMFLPMLQMVDGSSTVDPEGLGSLRFLLDGIEGLGIRLNLFSVLSFLCIFFFLKGIMKLVSGAYRVSVQQYFMRKIRLQLLDALNDISYKFFVSSDAGRIQNTLSGEADRVIRAYQSYFQSFEQGVLVGVYMLFAFFVDPGFALLVSLGGVFTNILYKKIYKLTIGASRELTRYNHIYQGLIIQHVAHFKYLKATGYVQKFGQKLRNSILQIENVNRRIGLYNAILNAAREPLLIFVIACVILLQTVVLGGALGPVLISLLFFYRALTALLALQNSWNMFLNVSGSMENMTSFQKELTSWKEVTGSMIKTRFEKSMEMDGVTFYYTDKVVLKNIHLQISRNESIAFVGESGSGKTTLVSILSCLMLPEAGKYRVDDLDVSLLELNSFRKRIGFVSQDPVIFNDTIFNNITFWDTPTIENHERMWKSLRQSSLSDYVEDLPEKDQTVLGNNGINLSGGQKQRIAIARELYKDIDILILDEATSSLDSETEKYIQESIEALKGHYTLLIVAHRLSTIKHVDRVVILRNGTIERIGSFHELMVKSASFKRMVELQEF